MKHHIAIKFLAILLATLSLFCAIASGLGVFTLAALDLYENSVADLYEENMENTRQHFAVNLVHRYASLNLGKLPEDYLNQYYGTHWQYDTFQYGHYFYTIFDETGRVVEDTATDVPSDAEVYHIQVTEVNYRTLVKTSPVIWNRYDTDEFPDDATLPPEEEYLYDNTETAAETTAPQEWTPGTVVPETTDPDYIPATSVPATEVPPTTQPEALPEETTPDETIFEETAAPTLAAGAATSYAEATADKAAYSNYVAQDTYYDHTDSVQMNLYYTIQELPPYTVELYLLPGAAPVEYVYSLLLSVWMYRIELFYVLGISILLFAIFAVYLCCAAGKKPGREEIHAGGFNCIPLDLYLCAGGFTIALILVYGAEAADYLLRSSPKILIPVIGLAGLACCLIFVSFCFACAAQFKTPGLYWWHNSIAGRCLRLAYKLWKWMILALVWLWKRTPKALRGCFRAIKVVCLWAWNLTAKLLRICWNLIVRVFRAVTWRMVRIYSLLPLTWQWLLVGFVMLALMAVPFAANGEELLVVLCLAACFGIILYGAHAFGILMEGARRMGQGDLETKVSDQFLLGAFRDFAKDLNALANVAVVAAQKQMKSERMKTELITNVSHDIKTPLTSIINYVDLLKKAETDEDKEVCLEVLSRQSQQLKKLIEDLMEMSKASTGNMNVDITSVNAAEAINQALGEFSDKLDRAQLIPVFRQPESPIYMQADGRLAWRVMSNLLSNAVKYALPGTRVYIDLMELEGKVIISMKNISREELNVNADELLERFVRGDASRNTEGSGLGLNIAKSLMEIQKGQLQLLVDGDLFKVTLVFPSTTI